MTTPNRVRAFVNQLAENGSLDERLDRVDVRGLAGASLIAELREVARLWQDGGFGSFEALDALGDDLDLATLSEVEGELRLIITKRSTDTTSYFLTPQGVRHLLIDAGRVAKTRRVLVAEAFDAFQTVSCSFEPWITMVEDITEPCRLQGVVPRRIVRDQLAQVPLSIGPILLDSAPAQASTVFEVWRAVAAPQLLTTLCDEIWSVDGVTTIALSGPRRRRLIADFDAVLPERDLGPAMEAASWIYDSGRDVETRHTLFTYELAREWPADTPFALGFAARVPDALEAAKSAFRMHVREASKETLKSLQDLRKSLSEDVARMVTQTRELVATTWRDFLVVVAALLGRMALVSSSKSSELDAAEWLLIGTAIYLTFSIIITIASNASFMRLARESRAEWKTKLYGFLDEKDFKKLAADPLDKAERIYRRARNVACCAYVILIVGLIVMAIVSGIGAGRAEASEEDVPFLLAHAPTSE
ncbi:hypothetical protein [Inquilinus sp. Marseille-Q2685]|uniref:hypothetical protein n=1 Tax=Inquilinus sp. Marseille-Q2685 TaxID=2866581 RepID=UPI001CE45484|nr:hypothetical protein [Inquilinus sp. Marseille-Q2685]